MFQKSSLTYPVVSIRQLSSPRGECKIENFEKFKEEIRKEEKEKRNKIGNSFLNIINKILYLWNFIY